MIRSHVDDLMLAGKEHCVNFLVTTMPVVTVNELLKTNKLISDIKKIKVQVQNSCLP